MLWVRGVARSNTSPCHGEDHRFKSGRTRQKILVPPHRGVQVAPPLSAETMGRASLRGAPDVTTVQMLNQKLS